MSTEERDTLANFLRADDGSLSERDQKFSGKVADEIEALEEEEE